MAQTAVEWLIEQLTEIHPKAFEQAKAMEKEMMNKNIKFICHGCGTKHTGENDDQMYEVCKQCFTNL